ncbi:MAG: peptidoglycan-binding protein [Geobacter sp.]|nr:peptidoglycan-binding protein [Geobacter sp.]
MASYKLGSKGDEVRKIQDRLKALALYAGPLDGDFGGGTQSAVKAFQVKEGLTVDGVVGPESWRTLFREEVTKLPLAQKPLDHRCLALTGSFETGAAFPDCFAGISGDFDGQGMSFGVLQWNFGQKSLQPLLKDMLRDHRETAARIFGSKLPVLEEILKADQEEVMQFARSIQHPVKHFVTEPWKGMFKALGRTDEFQQIELRYAKQLFDEAVALCAEYGLWSERAVAMMFDIKVQNGSIGKVLKQRILARFADLPAGAEEEKEVARMKVVANLRAEAANAKWVEDVRSRKLCCANGTGSVHNILYDLQEQFGIRLARHPA